MQTDYSKAWTAYKKSKDYERAVKAMSEKGIKQPYLDNILQGAFEAAWNLKGVVQQPMDFMFAQWRIL